MALLPPGAPHAPVGLPPVAALTRIGTGRSADIFALPDGRVLKLLLPGTDRMLARREVAAVMLASRMGVAVPAAERPVAAEGRVGFRMEKIEGETALAQIRRAPLPETHVVLAARAEWSLASAQARAAALMTLAGLPHGNQLCHGDLHPDNLMVAPRGLVAIDWSRATRGDPRADVARTALLLGYASYGRHLLRFAPLRAIRHLVAWWYVRCYCKATGISRPTIAAWRVPVAVAWLHEGSGAFAPGLNRMLVRELRRARPHSRSA